MQETDLLARLRRSAWITAAVFFVSALALALWLYTTDSFAFSDFASHARQIGASTIAAVFALSLANFFLRATRWHWYARQMGIATSFRMSVSHYISGFSMGVTPGRVGEVIRLWMLNVDFQTRYHRALPLLIADRVNDLLAIIFLALGASLVTTGVVSVGILIAVALMVAAYFLLRHPRLLIASVDGLYALVRRFDRLFAGLRRSLRLGQFLFSFRNSAVAAPLSFFAWFAECVGFFLILTALDSNISLSSTTFIYAFATLVGALTFLPGGVGGFEATAIVLLGASGIDSSVTVIAVTTIRVATLWFSVALGWIFLTHYLVYSTRNS